MWQFHVPFTACLAAPAGSGKSTFILKFLRHLPELVDGTFEHIVWCYGEEAGLPSDVIKNPTIRTYRGVPDEESGVLKPNTLLILDDLMNFCLNDLTISELYTKGSRHRRISVFILTQNLFHQSKHARSISLSTRYFVLIKNCRDKAQFLHLARQVYPENARSLCQALSDAWSLPFSYFVIDLDPSTDESLRFRTNIWPSDPYMVVYATERSIEQLRDRGQVLNNSFGNVLLP
ncbi:hypothetical protein ONE63_008131 [Megalurothrips usitatus]|uniref:Uncharacterized protein n=1 Tax=Megalurothrips usitatus TaxID=439358 RepID=A0AAV7XK75_9NEOP|nr:hypothetical protein ONE63_008131 [Megalurothrips usitatus]